MIKYNQTRYVDEDYPRIVFQGHNEEGTITHEIPMQAIADRMELLGLESIEQTLEYIGLEARDTKISDLLHEPMQQAYVDVVRSEFAQSLMPMPVVQKTGRQTLMEPMAISPNKRQHLDDVRKDVLTRLGMVSVIHSEPMVRAMDSTRPVERTRPAASEALGATEGAVSDAVGLVQEHLQEIVDWRMMNLVLCVPQLKEQLQDNPDGS